MSTSINDVAVEFRPCSSTMLSAWSSQRPESAFFSALSFPARGAFSPLPSLGRSEGARSMPSRRASPCDATLWSANIGGPLDALFCCANVGNT